MVFKFSELRIECGLTFATDAERQAYEEERQAASDAAVKAKVAQLKALYDSNPKFTKFTDDDWEEYAKLCLRSSTYNKLAWTFRANGNLELDPEIAEWAQFSYEEILAMEANGVLIPDEVLAWAHSMQDNDVTSYEIGEDSEDELNGTGENSASSELKEMQKKTRTLSEKSETTKNEMNAAFEEFKKTSKKAEEVRREQETTKKDSLKKIDDLTDEWKRLTEKVKKGSKLSEAERNRYKELGALLNGKDGELMSDILASTDELQELIDSMDGLEGDIADGIDLGDETTAMATELALYEKGYENKNLSQPGFMTGVTGVLKDLLYGATGQTIAIDALDNGNNLIEFSNTLGNTLMMNQYASLYEFAETFTTSSTETIDEAKESMGADFNKTSKEISEEIDALPEMSAAEEDLYNLQQQGVGLIGQTRFFRSKSKIKTAESLKSIKELKSIEKQAEKEENKSQKLTDALVSRMEDKKEEADKLVEKKEKAEEKQKAAEDLANAGSLGDFKEAENLEKTSAEDEFTEEDQDKLDQLDDELEKAGLTGQRKLFRSLSKIEGLSELLETKTVDGLDTIDYGEITQGLGLEVMNKYRRRWFLAYLFMIGVTAVAAGKIAQETGTENNDKYNEAIDKIAESKSSVSENQTAIENVTNVERISIETKDDSGGTAEGAAEGTAESATQSTAEDAGAPAGDEPAADGTGDEYGIGSVEGDGVDSAEGAEGGVEGEGEVNGAEGAEGGVEGEDGEGNSEDEEDELDMDSLTKLGLGTTELINKVQEVGEKSEELGEEALKEMNKINKEQDRLVSEEEDIIQEQSDSAEDAAANIGGEGDDFTADIESIDGEIDANNDKSLTVEERLKKYLEKNKEYSQFDNDAAGVMDKTCATGTASTVFGSVLIMTGTEMIAIGVSLCSNIFTLHAGMALVAQGTVTVTTGAGFVGVGAELLSIGSKGLKATDITGEQIDISDENINTALEALGEQEEVAEDKVEEDDEVENTEEAVQNINNTVGRTADTTATGSTTAGTTSGIGTTGESTGEGADEAAAAAGKSDKTESSDNKKKDQETSADEAQETVDNLNQATADENEDTLEKTDETEKTQKEIEKEMKNLQKQMKKDNKQLEKIIKESQKIAQEKERLADEFEELNTENEEIVARQESQEAEASASGAEDGQGGLGDTQQTEMAVSGDDTSTIETNQARQVQISAIFKNYDQKLNTNQTKVRKISTTSRKRRKKFDKLARQRQKMIQDYQKAEEKKQAKVAKSLAVIGVQNNIFSITVSVGTALSCFWATAALGAHLIAIGTYGMASCQATKALVLIASGNFQAGIMAMASAVITIATSMIGAGAAGDAVSAAAGEASGLTTSALNAAVQITSATLNTVSAVTDTVAQVNTLQGKETSGWLNTISQISGAAGAVASVAGGFTSGAKRDAAGNITKSTFASSTNGLAKAAQIVGAVGQTASTAATISTLIKQARGEDPGELEAILGLVGSSMSTAAAVMGMAGSISGKKEKTDNTGNPPDENPPTTNPDETTIINPNNPPDENPPTTNPDETTPTNGSDDAGDDDDSKNKEEGSDGQAGSGITGSISEQGNTDGKQLSQQAQQEVKDALDNGDIDPETAKQIQETSSSDENPRENPNPNTETSETLMEQTEAKVDDAIADTDKLAGEATDTIADGDTPAVNDGEPPVEDTNPSDDGTEVSPEETSEAELTEEEKQKAEKKAKRKKKMEKIGNITENAGKGISGGMEILSAISQLKNLEAEVETKSVNWDMKKGISLMKKIKKRREGLAASYQARQHR